MEDQVFTEGQVVVCVGSYMHQLTQNKQYTVVKYEPEFYSPTFTWPAYVTVIGDFEKPVSGHAPRFHPLTEEEVSQCSL